jgi:hypothetical protein
VRAGDHREALSASCAALVAFQGVCHETVGPLVFPYGPELFGGPVGWHAFGLLIIAVGAYLFVEVLRGTWRWVKPLSWLLILLGAGIFAFTAIRYRDLHVFALTGALCGVGLLACERLDFKERLEAE